MQWREWWWHSIMICFCVDPHDRLLLFSNFFMVTWRLTGWWELLGEFTRDPREWCRLNLVAEYDWSICEGSVFYGSSFISLYIYLWSLLQVKPDYIPDIMTQTGCPVEFSFRLQGSPKWPKSAIFSIFSDFSIITAELFILEENFCLLKYRFQCDASFPFFGFSLRRFSGELLEKILEFTKSCCLSS